MRKKRNLKKRLILPDPVYNSTLIAKAINIVMQDGKKQLARRLVYGAFDIVEKKIKKPAFEVFNDALKNIAPTVELKTRKIGGANYQVPVESSTERKETLSLRWLIVFSRKRTEKTFSECLASEIIDAYNNTGLSIKKRNETIKTAESNKAFAYFRF